MAHRIRRRQRDFVTREEFDAVRAMAQKAHEELRP
jgi:BMFP domain-containing protein YqiC